MASNHEELEQIMEMLWSRAMGNLAHVFVFCLHTKVEVGQWNMKSSSMFSVFNFVFALIWAPSDLELASILVLDEQKNSFDWLVMMLADGLRLSFPSPLFSAYIQKSN